MKISITKLLLVLTLSSTTFLMGFANTDKLIAQAKKDTAEIEPKALKKMLDDEDDVTIVDVRESEQRAEGEIVTNDSYFSITRGNLEFEIGKKIDDKDAFIVTYCRGGSRGALAAQTLRKLGYKNATNLKGGLKAWTKAGYSIKTGLGITTLVTEKKE